ncbi:unnamed protein product, partial [Prorocentrum cordatum]
AESGSLDMIVEHGRRGRIATPFWEQPPFAVYLEQTGWQDRLPARGHALLLLGHPRYAGGGKAEFASVTARRNAQLPQ